MATSEEGEDAIEPFVIRDEPIRAPARPSASRNAGAESAAVWGTVALIGAVVGIYVLVKPPRPAVEPAPAPAPVVVEAPARPAKAARSAPRKARSPAPVAAAPAVTVHAEPERKAVDPIQGFDSNEAFDNPASPGRYGQRRSGLYDPAPARPNRPDPSFEPK